MAPDGDIYGLSDNLPRITWNEPPFYLDASCTEEGVISANPLPAGTILSKEVLPPGGLQHLFHLGARVTGSVYLRDSYGGCHALPNNPSRATYHFGGEVTGNTFVKGVLRQHVSKDGVAAHFVEGEDGSFSPLRRRTPHEPMRDRCQRVLHRPCHDGAVCQVRERDLHGVFHRPERPLPSSRRTGDSPHELA